MTQAELNQLVAALRDRSWPTLSDDQTVVLLSWLAHSRRNPGVGQLEELVGPAGYDDDAFDAALSILDIHLFDAESLRARQAGLGPEMSRDARRRRYRLLMSAFHPDRYPGRVEWLTARSQIITRSYARFKSEPDVGQQADFGLTVATPGSPRPAPFRRAPVYKGISPDSPKSESFYERLARDRFLAHKVVGGLSLLVILPVISILLDRPDRPDVEGYLTAETGLESRAPIQSPFVDWPLPEAETMDWSTPIPGSLLPIQTAYASLEPLAWPEPQASESPDWLLAASVPLSEAPVEDIVRTESAGRPSSPSTLQENLIVAPIRIVEDTASRIAEVMAYLPESEDTPVIDALPRMPGQTIESDAPVEADVPLPEAAVLEPETPPAADPDPVVVAAVKVPESTEIEAEPVERIEALEPLQSQLALGPLANHPAGRLLDSYHRSIEQGDLAGLLEMLTPSADFIEQQDRSAFEQNYREMFASSRKRGLTLRVLHARRQDSGWLVRTDYQLEMLRSDSGDVERVRREVEYSMTEDDGRLRIASISY